MIAAGSQLRDQRIAGNASCADVMLSSMWQPVVGAFTPFLDHTAHCMCLQQGRALL